jgi:polysaccharide transporter, PST family
LQSDLELPARKRMLADNIVSLYVLQGLNYIVPLAVLPYLVRILGMDRYGLIAFSQSFAQYFSVLTDYGFNYSATRSIARSRGDREAISRHFCSVFLIKFTLTCLGALILFTVLALVPSFHSDAQYFWVAYFAVIGNVLFPVWFYQGIEKMRYISIISGAAKLISAAALFVFVRHPQDALLALAILSLGTLAGGVAGLVLVFMRFDLRPRRPTCPELRAALREGWHLFVSTAAISLYTNTNVFLVGLLSGNLEAGYFSAADKLIRAMQGLIAPVSQAVFPHMSSLASESRDHAMAFARKTLRWMGGLTFVPSVALLVAAPWVATLLFGQAGVGSVPVIRWIALLPFIIAISNVLGIQTMIPFGLDRQFSRILIAAGVVNVALAVPLIRLFGAEGAGAAVLCTEFIITLTMILLLQKRRIFIFRRETETA